MQSKLFASMLAGLVLSVSFTAVHAQFETGQFFQSEQHYFSIVFPAGWQLQQSPYPGIIAQAVSPERAQVSINVEHFSSVTKLEDDPTGKEIQRELDGAIDTLRQSFPDLRVLDRSVTYMSNRPAGRLLVEATVHFGDAKALARMEYVQLVQYGRVYTFTAVARPKIFRASKQTFQAVLGSFNLEHWAVSASPERSILGKWRGTDGSRFEFRSNGLCAFLYRKQGAVLNYVMEGREPPYKLTISVPKTGQTVFEGTVSFRGSHVIELDLQPMGKALFTKVR